MVVFWVSFAYTQHRSPCARRGVDEQHVCDQPPRDISRDEQRKWAYQRFIKDYLRCVAGIDENIGRLLKYVLLLKNIGRLIAAL